MRVTSLVHDERSGGVRIQLDERPFGTIGAADVVELGLAEGRPVVAATEAELVRRAETFSARVVALRMIAARALSSAEVLRRLLRKGHAKPASEAAVAALLGSGLINDQQFAQHYASTRSRRQRFGPRRLMADLRRMGVAEKDATAAVRDALEAEGVDPRSVLREAAQKKARSLGGLDPQTARRRLRAYLLRRGFGGAEVSAVVKEAVPR